MAIDTRDKRQGVTSITSRGSLGLDPYTGMGVRDRANTSYMYSLSADALPVPTDNIQILYPIQPVTRVNKLVFQKGNGEWASVQKSADTWRHELITLRYRARDDYFKIFYQFLVQNKGNTVILELCKVQPFIRSDESNFVTIVTFTVPQRVLHQYWEISVTYRNILTS